MPWNWCGIIGSFTQRRPTAFHETVVDDVSGQIQQSHSEFKRLLLAGVVTDTV